MTEQQQDAQVIDLAQHIDPAATVDQGVDFTVDSSGTTTPEPVYVPTPALAGTFAIYEDGNGGFVLVTETDQHGTMRKHVPAALVKMATGGGMLGRKLGGLFG